MAQMAAGMLPRLHCFALTQVQTLLCETPWRRKFGKSAAVSCYSKCIVMSPGDAVRSLICRPASKCERAGKHARRSEEQEGKGTGEEKEQSGAAGRLLHGAH